jgi:hypothetical protein
MKVKILLHHFVFQYLSIAPVRGYLNPGEGKMCRVIFIACGQPSFYDLDLVCEVIKFVIISLVYI